MATVPRATNTRFTYDELIAIMIDNLHPMTRGVCAAYRGVFTLFAVAPFTNSALITCLVRAKSLIQTLIARCRKLNLRWWAGPTQVALMLLCLTPTLAAQSLEQDLLQTPAAELVKLAQDTGDPARGAIVFHQQQMLCSKCHVVGKTSANVLGPDLAALGKEITDEALVEAVLAPSKTIRKGFETVTVLTTDGRSITALLVKQTQQEVIIREVSRGGEPTTLKPAEIEAIKPSPLSLMPAGQVNQLNSRQQFLDLIRYLIEIRTGGARRAAELQPPASLLTFVVPEYESHLDHAGLISSWNADGLKRGEAIYQRVCANCHGTKDKPGSLPTSLRFAEGKFKNGSDPLSMYRTLTHGFGLMAPQTWMVPAQKYDVIHYIRETYLKPHNPSQMVAVDADYLARLPKGDTRGPEPSKIVPWSAMDYGPSLTHTYEVPGVEHNFAYKGVAVRLDPGAGGVSRGRHWLVFDTDTLRVAAAWSGTGNAEDNFIDWQGIQFNGAHGVHPRLVGHVAVANSTGPGWADPASQKFVDDRRILGRDNRRYGPLPRDWGQYRGHYAHGQQTIFSYTLGDHATSVLELPGLKAGDETAPPLVLRTFNIGPRERELVLQVAEHPDSGAKLEMLSKADASVVRLVSPQAAAARNDNRPFAFDGGAYLEVPRGEAFDLTSRDYSLVARLKTKHDGTIWSQAPLGSKWAPDGQTWFIRGGRLTFDIGWVGAVAGRKKIDDGEWHQVAMTWEKKTNQVRLYVDGKLDAEGKLAAKQPLAKGVVRIGFTSPNFPQQSFFQGEIEEVRFYQRRLTAGLEMFPALQPADKTLSARWLCSSTAASPVRDTTGNGHDAEVRRGAEPKKSSASPVIAGVAPRGTPVEWLAEQGKLRLKIPAGKDPLRFTVWQPLNAVTKTPWADVHIPEADRDLLPLTAGGPPRWPQKLETNVAVGGNNGPFATDVLTAPETNPWLAQTRFSGLDFFADGSLAVCSWDGDVWRVEEQQAGKLIWQRIATGLFQPLGLKILGDKIHLTCRDQLAVLHDLNGDREIDFYECLNNDHQVTDHFHEFAMGLQTDAEGNFYYAKSGFHGKAALLPQHGTLLKVSKDGARTEILANGFRAANGVCLNPDGSFFVTDQEGFWNPKNRINWVTPSSKPKFYGNMLGYHDVTDTSDAAMEPPLCWITNAFDRSPAELLWVDSPSWGPLQGSLLNLSYGYGKVFVVPHEKVGGLMQGGMIELPIPSFPTGVMRGRFQPRDGQLYLCGMFAWAGNATGPGGLYRLRATGQPMHLPIGLHATKSGLQLKFTEPLDAKSLDAKSLQIKTWSLKRTANYGSKHYDEQALNIDGAKLSADGKTLTIHVPDIKPTWCMEIKYSLLARGGQPVVGVIHSTIHALGDEPGE